MEQLQWSHVLSAPAFVINMDRCPERWESSQQRLKAAGFTNINRFKAIDGTVDDLEDAWKIHGSPRMDQRDTDFVDTFKEGKQGCTLSQITLWKHIIDNNIQYAVVFEDDIDFHERWCDLAKTYWDHTPRDFDILFLGSQIDGHITYDHITVVPTYCMHAYMVSLEGVRKLYELCVRYPTGIKTFDCILNECMHRAFITHGEFMPFRWYSWNATMYFDAKALKGSKFWAIRNHGLVFQDANFGSHIKMHV